jgi:hypothetical protein
VSKYRPLQEYLREQTSPRLELTLSEIEQIIGHQLPPSAYAPHWWISGASSRHRPLWQEAWRAAGYEAALVRMTDRVEFRRLA